MVIRVPECLGVVPICGDGFSGGPASNEELVELVRRITITRELGIEANDGDRFSSRLTHFVDLMFFPGLGFLLSKGRKRAPFFFLARRR